MPQAVANRYANALADAVFASAAGSDVVANARKALDELRNFEQVAADSPELQSILLSPAVAGSRKRAVIRRLAENLGSSTLVRNLLYVLVDRRRIDILTEIGQAFEAVLDQRLGIVHAAVTSAAPLPGQQQAELQKELSRVAGKPVRCEFSIDPALIGGVVARIGSTVYDGSVRTQLEQLRERLTTH